MHPITIGISAGKPLHQKHDFSSFHISWTQFAAYPLSTKTSSSKSTFPFHSKRGPRGEVHSLFCLWFDVSFYNALPPGSLRCDGRATWRAHAGTKWPSRASTAETSERSGRSGQGYDTVEAIRLLSLHWRQMSSDFRAALLCPRPQTRHLDSDRKTRSVKNFKSTADATSSWYQTDRSTYMTPIRVDSRTKWLKSCRFFLV